MSGRVLHTREHGSPLEEMLRERGVEPVHVPLIARSATGDAPPVGPPAVALFTSPAAVRFAPMLASVLRGAVCVAVGEATAGAHRARGVQDVRVGSGGGAAVAALLRAVHEAAPGTIWHVRGRKTSRTVARSLLEQGLEPLPWVVYETRAAGNAVAGLATVGPVDAVCLASGSAARAYAGASRALRARVAVIGPDTAAVAREAGLEVHSIAATPDLEGLADAAVQALSEPSAG